MDRYLAMPVKDIDEPEVAKPTAQVAWPFLVGGGKLYTRFTLR